MPMNKDCKHYESRSYPSGDTVRKCNLDLAPEAPWRCPKTCESYQKRKFDIGFKYGSLNALNESRVKEPESLGRDHSISSLLDEAESIVNNAAPKILEEVRKGRNPKASKPTKRAGSRKSKKKKGKRR